MKRPSAKTARQLSELAAAREGWESLAEYLGAVADYLDYIKDATMVTGVLPDDEILIRRTHKVDRSAPIGGPS